MPDLISECLPSRISHLAGHPPPISPTVSTICSSPLGIPNPLFADSKTIMLFGDGLEMVQAIIKALKEK